MIFENHDGAVAVIGVAIMATVGEPRSDFSQIALPDWLTAQHTESLRSGRSAVHQYESHVASSNAKRNDRGHFSQLQSALADYSETKAIEIEAQLYVGKRPISKGIGRVIRRFVVLACYVGATTWRANVAGPKGKSIRCVVAGIIGRHCNVLSADRGDSISGGRMVDVQQISH